MVSEPQVLILGSRYDFSCDYVVAHLAASGKQYLRLNSEDLPAYDLSLNPLTRHLSCRIKDKLFHVTQENLRSVWFRRAVYPREIGAIPKLKAEDQIARSQWAAFVRGLIVFDKAKWINHPGATYIAEQKPYQLAIANDCGFLLPDTLVANHLENDSAFDGGEVAIKGVDTVIGYEEGQEIFAFTNILRVGEIANEDLSSCPTIIQRAIAPKIDVRVTVIGDDVFAVSILQNGKGISGDWRLHKTDISYIPTTLPQAVADSCRALTKNLGLVFGAIDLLQRSDEYYFLEINPTGEWAWLVDSAKLKIDEAIASALLD